MAARKAAVDSFLVVLTIALLLLVAATVVFGVFGGQIGVTGRTITSFSAIGPVGFLVDLPAQSIVFVPFTAGTKQLDTLRKVPEVTLTSFVSGSQSLALTLPVPAYYTDTLTGVKISFDVYRTGFTPLRVKWNGKEVLTDVLGTRPYTVFVPKEDVKDVNYLDIVPDGPGLAFWASNSYTLRDLTIAVEYGPAKLTAFELSSSDLQSFSRGELSFYSLGEGGTLTIRLNGQAIFDQFARGPHSVNFTLSTAPLRLGNNILSFSASGGEFDLRNGELRLYTTGTQQIKERTFTLTADQLAGLSTGTVRMNVSTVSRQGNIKASLNSRIILDSAMSPGTLTSTFPLDAYTIGSNTLRLSGTGAAEVESVTLSGV